MKEESEEAPPGPTLRVAAVGAATGLGFVLGGALGAALLAAAVASLAFLLDHQLALTVGVGLLVATTVCTSAGDDDLAESMALGAFSFLTLGVALGVIAALRDRHRQDRPDGR